MKKVSYIFPIYNEQDNIAVLFESVRSVTEKLSRKYTFEYIFVNDGSRDRSLDALLRLRKSGHSVKIIDLARNFGHQMAVTAGIDVAEGDAAIIMDSDLQDPPSVSADLIDQWENGYEVVYAQRISRDDTPFKKLTAHMFYRTLSILADIDIPRDTGDFRLIDRKVIDEIRRFREHNRFLRGMFSYVGFSQTAVPFRRDKRHSGTTGYPLRKMIKFASDGIFSFSSFPLRFISRMGYGIAALSLIAIVYALVVYLLGSTVEGWTFIVISIFFVGGIQLIMLGVLGEYIGRIYTEVQNRPLYSVRTVYGSNALEL